MIEFANVSKIYESGDTGLDNVSFAIQPGEFVFLVGASGSGKSTTMRLLIKETEATSGAIHVAGRELNAIPRRRVPSISIRWIGRPDGSDDDSMRAMPSI